MIKKLCKIARKAMLLCFAGAALCSPLQSEAREQHPATQQISTQEKSKKAALKGNPHSAFEWMNKYWEEVGGKPPLTGNYAEDRTSRKKIAEEACGIPAAEYCGTKKQNAIVVERLRAYFEGKATEAAAEKAKTPAAIKPEALPNDNASLKPLPPAINAAEPPSIKKEEPEATPSAVETPSKPNVSTPTPSPALQPEPTATPLASPDATPAQQEEKTSLTVTPSPSTAVTSKEKQSPAATEQKQSEPTPVMGVDGNSFLQEQGAFNLLKVQTKKPSEQVIKNSNDLKKQFFLANVWKSIVGFSDNRPLITATASGMLYILILGIIILSIRAFRKYKNYKRAKKDALKPKRQVMPTPSPRVKEGFQRPSKPLTRPQTAAVSESSESDPKKDSGDVLVLKKPIPVAKEKPDQKKDSAKLKMNR